MKIKDESDIINSLKTRIGKGFLSNLVWNIRNRYLSADCNDFTPSEMQMVVEGFLAELTATNASKKQTAIDATMLEVEKATSKFPTWPTDPIHALAVLGEEFGELTKAVLQHTYEPHKATSEDVREEAIQTAAMAIRFLMSLDQYEYQRGEQHSQTDKETE